MHQTPDTLKGIIFDCDGVLIDSWNSTRYFFNRIRKGVGLPPMTGEEERFVFVSTVDQGIARIIPHELVELAHEVKKTITVQDLLPHLSIQPGLINFLEFLQANGVRRAVNTNGGAETAAICTALGLSGYFDLMVTADDVTFGKPDPEGVRRILDSLELSPTEVVFIGDSHIDQKTSSQASVRFWAFGNPALKADLHAQSYAQLQTLFTSG